MIHAVGYDESTQTLEVVFNSGKIYQDYEVPREIYEELLAADLKGSGMRDEVIDCYPYQQVRRRYSRMC